MRQLWLPPGRLTFSSCLGWFLTVCRVYVGLPFGASEEALLLRRPLNKSGPTGLGWKSSSPVFPSCLGWTLRKAQSPLLVCKFHPYNSPSKFRLLLSRLRRKGGILTYIGLFTVDSCFTRAAVCFSRDSLMTEVFNDPGGANYCF